MSKAKKLLNESSIKLTRYSKFGGTRSPIHGTEEKLESGVYSASVDFNGGVHYTQKEIKSDTLIRSGVNEYNTLLEEIDKFWGVNTDFRDMGFLHKRGIILHGLPGTGKTSILSMVMEKVIADDGVVFTYQSSAGITSTLKTFREVEPDRKVLVILEDFDNFLGYGEGELLQILDGHSQVDNVLYIATTNYIDRIPDRMKKRPSRFDRVVEVKPPNADGRKEYFKSKLSGKEPDEIIDSYTEKTDGFTFAHLKEFLISVYCLGNKVDDTVSRLLDMSPSTLKEASNDKYDLEASVAKSCFEKKFAVKKFYEARG